MMGKEILDQIVELGRPIAVSSVALALIAVVTAGVRHYSQAPLDPVGVIEGAIPRGSEFVNVEYREATGGLMNLGPYVHAALRNGQGPPSDLQDGFFKVPSKRGLAGMPCMVTIDGGVQERVQLQVDGARGGILYVQSQYTAAQIFERVNGRINLGVR